MDSRKQSRRCATSEFTTRIIRKYKSNKKNLQYELSDIAGKIYTILDILPCTQDEIMEKLRKRKDDTTVPELRRGLLELEMQQIVSRTGGQYRLTKPKI